MDNDEAGKYLDKPMQLLFLLYIKKKLFSLIKSKSIFLQLLYLFDKK